MKINTAISTRRRDLSKKMHKNTTFLLAYRYDYYRILIYNIQTEKKTGSVSRTSPNGKKPRSSYVQFAVGPSIFSISTATDEQLLNLMASSLAAKLW